MKILSNDTKSHVELFHLLFLEHLSQKLDGRLYTLKGGCNLRFFLDSMRYSEDMDLDVHTVAVGTLRKTVDKILSGLPFKQALALRSIQINAFSAPKQSNTTQRWKVQLNLLNQTLPIHTKIEFSRRITSEAGKFEPILKKWTLQYHLRTFFVNHYQAETALLQKIKALVNRTETQARDVFDIYHLLNSQKMLAMPELNTKEVEQAINHMFDISFQVFKSQVVSYLEADFQQQFNDKAVWEHILLSIAETLREKC